MSLVIIKSTFESARNEESWPDFMLQEHNKNLQRNQIVFNKNFLYLSKWKEMNGVTKKTNSKGNIIEKERLGAKFRILSGHPL